MQLQQSSGPSAWPIQDSNRYWVSVVPSPVPEHTAKPKSVLWWTSFQPQIEPSVSLSVVCSEQLWNILQSWAHLVLMSRWNTAKLSIEAISPAWWLDSLYPNFHCSCNVVCFLSYLTAKYCCAVFKWLVAHPTHHGISPVMVYLMDRYNWLLKYFAINYTKAGVIQGLKSDIFTQTKRTCKPIGIWLKKGIQNLTQQ